MHRECKHKALQKTTALHHEGKLPCLNFTFNIRLSALPKTTLHREGNLMHASFLFIMKQSYDVLDVLITQVQCHFLKQHCIMNGI